MHLAVALLTAYLQLSLPGTAIEKAFDSEDTRTTQTLRQMAEQLQAQDTLTVSAEGKLVMQGPGVRNEKGGTFHVALDRPDKLALRFDGGFYGTTLVSDSATVTRFNHLNDNYTLTSAPASLESLLDSLPSGKGLNADASSILAKLLSSAAYERLTREVTSSTFVGDMQVDGVATTHLKLGMGELEEEWWIANETQLPVRMTLDLSSAMRRSGGSHPTMRNMTTKLTVEFRDWKPGETLPDSAFAYTLPPTAKQIEAEPVEEEERSPLLGTVAPDFTLPLLTGGEFKLAETKGKVVILDFWASWCGPCREGLPIISEVALKLHDQGVEFLAVNLREEATDARKFLDNEKLVLPVGLDKEGEVGDKYLVEGIPQTVVIGKDGTVQVVHVGFGPGTGSILEEEVKSLLAGKVLATATTGTTTSKSRGVGRERSGTFRGDESETTRPATPKRTTVSAPDTATSFGVSLAWNLEGTWTAVASDPTGSTAYAINRKGEGGRVTGDGKVEILAKFPEAYSSIRLANFTEAADPEVLGYQSGGPWVRAFTFAGKELWSQEEPGAVNDITAFDTDGDGTEEVLLARKEGAALQVVSSKGEVLWKHEDFTSVLRVSGGRLKDDAESCILAMGAEGTLRAFDAKGENYRDLKTPCKATSVECVNVTTGVVLLVGGTGKVRGSREDFEVLVCVNTDGSVNWQVPVGNPKARQDALHVSPGAEYVAVSMRGGVVHVYRMTDGSLAATATAQGLRPEVAWMKSADGKQPLLMIATGNRLNAYRISR